MNSICFVDVQGFKNDKNCFIIKEFAIATPKCTQVYLLKSPQLFSNLSKEEKRHVKWIERNRGIFWSDGYLNLIDFKHMITPLLREKTIYVKGVEKVKWIKDLCESSVIINIENNGCPKLSELIEKYCEDKLLFKCIYHDKCCSLINAICIREWYYDKNNKLSFN